MKKVLAVWVCLMLFCATACAVEFEDRDADVVYDFSSAGTTVRQSREILISATGDVTLGGNMKGNPASNI